MRDWGADIRARLADARLDPAAETDIVEELAQHLEDQFREMRARGVSEQQAEATLVAQLSAPEFPHAILARRRAAPSLPAPIGSSHDARGLITSVWHDVRYGWRSLRRAPAFTTVAVISLGLGIGATTAIFGLLHAVLLERLAVPHPERVIAVEWSSGFKKTMGLNYAELTALKSAPGLPVLAGSAGGQLPTVIRNARDYTPSDRVTGGYFEVLGVRPLIGRTISPEDDANGAAVVVISEDLWRNRLESDPAALGEKVTLNNHPFTVIGVLPRSYHGMYVGGSFSIAIPLGARGLVGPLERQPRDLNMSVVGRLAPGMTRESAGAAIDRVYRQCCLSLSGARLPKVAAGDSKEQPVLQAVDASRGLTSGKVDLRGQYRRLLIVLMTGVSIVLLIACANVGNLLLVRAAARRRELAVRMSMGATRTRLVQQLLIEGLQVATVGGVLGLLLARLGTGLLSHNLPPVAAGLSDRITLRPSTAILAFTAAVTLGSTILFAVLPALRATRADIMSPLRDGSKGLPTHRWWSLDRGLVVVQVALALVLVCAATLFVATLRNLRQFDGGYRSSHVLLADVDTRLTPYESRGMQAFYPEILARARRIPGVVQVAAADLVPLIGGRSRSTISVPRYQASPDEDMSSWNNGVTAGFFATTGVGLRAGREFDASDTETSEPVVIINESFAKRFFAGRNPIGASVMLAGWRPARQARVVGIANDARYYDLRVPAEELYYFPLVHSGSPTRVSFVLRTSGNSTDVAAAFSREVDAVAPGLRMRRLVGIETALNEALSRERLSAALATVFGVFALGLAAIGLYGVVAYNVARRTSEIGLRMALGARPVDALWLVVRQTLAMTTIGLAIGVPLAISAAKAIGAQLYGIGATDPRAVIGAALLLSFAGALASVVPGRRAASVDPVEALRSDG